jgi:hypothetical protein
MKILKITRWMFNPGRLSKRRNRVRNGRKDRIRIRNRNNMMQIRIKRNISIRR